MNEEKTPFIENLNKQQTSAYHQLYDEYYKVLVLYAINFLSSQQAAEDIVQELFATMWEKKMKFLSLPSFRTYLYNSVRNASLNYLKHQNVESLYLEHLANTYREIIEEEEDTNEEEVYRLLFRAIDKLPTRCREVFLLHMDGKKNEEIATLLGISIETVKTQKKRAIQFIKEQMGTYYFLLPLCDILYSSKFFS
ncbi:RNA polymerase sigma-70 factor [Bacteroides finegoldii]|jgi:RNA polymerase sigma-70 factor (family 1)|uniref:RNA polymerase sigma-70 factor n=1 Tax=Bacteroides finegoldii TaxID=338188 RepID=UPI0022E4C7CD|nr:RNA polymerase sigma-70 factor [Bacteroides finegoldii]